MDLKLKDRLALGSGSTAGIGLRQLNAGSVGILFGMLDAGRFGDCEDRRPPHQKGKGDMAHGRLVSLRDLREEAAGRRVLPWKIAMPERTVCREADMVLLAPGQYGMFDRAFLQMVEHLIADNVRAAAP